MVVTFSCRPPLTHVGANGRLCMQRKKASQVVGQAKLHMYFPKYYANDNQELRQLNGGNSETCNLSNPPKPAHFNRSRGFNFMDFISCTWPTPVHCSVSKIQKATEARQMKRFSLTNHPQILAKGCLHKASSCLTRHNILEV